MPAPSLLSSCMKACIKNARNIEDVGALEYFQIKPILNRIDSADQLRRIELASPQIMGDDAELWQKFIAREIPGWKKKNYAPNNPVKWYEVYRRYHREQKEEIVRDQEILKQSLKGLQKQREEKNSRIEDLKNLPKVPKDPRMIANNGGVPLKGRAGAKTASVLTWNAGSKTKMTDGKGVLNRARREAMEISARKKLSRPTVTLGGSVGQVTKAPAAMTAQYRIAAQPAVRILSRKRAANAQPQLTNKPGPSLEEREERLRQAMKAKTSEGFKRTADDKIKPTYVDTSDEGDVSVEENSGLDDLFDSSKPSKSAQIVAVAPRAVKSMPPARPQSAGPSPKSTPGAKKDALSRILDLKPASPVVNSRVVRTERVPVVENKSATGTKPLTQSQSSNPSPATAIIPSAPPAGRRVSPESAGQQQGMIIQRKRKEVDIFNRRPNKRPRAA